MKIISASIDLTKIDKTKIVHNKNGSKYLNISIIVNDEPNDYDQDTSISISQTKEEREAKVKKVYIGNGKTVFVKKPESNQKESEQDKNFADRDDLPDFLKD